MANRGSKVPFVPKEAMEQRAAEFRERFRVVGKVCPIEEIVGVQLGIDIVEVADLHRHYDTNGLLSSDFSTIWVDKTCSEHYEEKFRFTLAHEVGHMELHRELHEEVHWGSITEYQSAVSSVLTDAEYRDLEWQADYFAGALLVSKEHLSAELGKKGETVIAQLKGLPAATYDSERLLDVSMRELCDRVAPEFCVAPRVIDLRLYHTGLKARFAKLLFGKPLDEVGLSTIFPPEDP